MIAKTITYQRLRNLGNYEHEREAGYAEAQLRQAERDLELARERSNALTQPEITDEVPF